MQGFIRVTNLSSGKAPKEWDTYNRPNVTLIDVSGEPIEAITPAGIRGRTRGIL